MTTEHIFADSYADVDDDGNLIMVLRCDGCTASVINGKPCHEHGCHLAWRDKKRECPWCGTKFYPEERDQKFCDESCAAAHSGNPLEEFWCCRNCGRFEDEVSPLNDDFCSELCQQEYYA